MSTKAMKQEGFSVEELVQERAIQQDRIQFEPGSCFLNFKGQEFELISLSCFDCTVRYTTEQLHELKKLTLSEASLEGILIYKNNPILSATLKWAQAYERTLEFEVAEQPIPTELVQATLSSLKVIEEQTAYAVALAQIPAEFKNLVYEMKDWLTQLKNKIDKLEAETPVDNLTDAEVYRTTIAQKVAEYLVHSIPAKYLGAPQMIADLSEEQKKWAVQFVREQVGHLVYGAPFASRAFFKPRGYAGDYEMMNHLYRNELVGKTLFDQCMHKYFIDEPAGAAVKNRGQYLYKKITELFNSTPVDQPLKVISIASGPAMEQQIFLDQGKEFYGRPAEFTCLDQDEASLKHAQKQLQSLEMSVKSGFEYKFNNMAIRNVIGRGLPETNYDLIYSAGLFDYFTERVARAAAVKMVAAVKPGGHVIIGNFSKNNPSVPFMELVLDWHLIYRSEDDLHRIFQGLGSKIWVEKEPLGINLFLVIRK